MAGYATCATVLSDIFVVYYTLGIAGMYTTHQLLQEPRLDTRLWRYMDLAKFLSLLESNALHLAALHTFDDPFEGQPPRSAIEPMTAQPPNLTPEVIRDRWALIENNLSVFQKSRHCLFASCWHMNETESAGMWSQYIKAGQGLAVQTTFDRLRSALTQEEPSVYGAVVQYIDFDTHDHSDVNLMAWGALKRSIYEHEREFRLIAMHYDPAGPAGLPVHVDVTRLVERVYVAPTTPDWMFELVRSLLVRYELGVEPVRSELYQGPKYMIVPPWAHDA